MDLLARRVAAEEAARAVAEAAAAQEAAAQAVAAVAVSAHALPAAPPLRRSRAPMAIALGLAFLAALGMGVAAQRLLHRSAGTQTQVSAD